MGRHALVLAFVLVAVPARADDAQDRAAAAFAEGERAFSAGNYKRAATLFDEAYAAAPHPATLFNAARAHAKAGENARAANLYARLDSDASAPKDRADAHAAIDALAPHVARVRVVGSDEATPTIDDAPVDAAGALWVEPGEHLVVGRSHGRTLRQRTNVSAGQSSTVELVDARSPPVPPPPGPVREENSFRLPRAVTYALAGATLIGAGVTTWSGIDVLDQKKVWDRTQRDADLDEGFDRQKRTNLLLGVTVGLAVLTGVAILLTDWKPHRSHE